MADVRTSELVINKLSKQQYENIQNPSDTEIYLVPEDEEHKPICYPTTADNVGATSMDLKSSVSDNGSKLTEVGFVYSDSNQSPTVSDTKVICNLGVGRIEKSLSGLSSNTSYYIRSYGINQDGTSYGNLLTESTINDYTPSDYNQFLQLWLKSDNALLINNKVKQWYDLSNNNFIISQTTESYMPTLNNSAINNYPALTFNGSSTYLTGGDILDLGNDSWTWFVVVKPNNPIWSEALLSKSLYGSEAGRYSLSARSLIYVTTNNLEYNVNILNQAVQASNWYIITWENNRTTSMNSLYVNGEFNNSVSFPAYNMQNSRRFLIGAYNGSSDSVIYDYFNGEIAEIIAFRKVDSIMRGNITGYLVNKYGFSL